VTPSYRLPAAVDIIIKLPADAVLALGLSAR